MITYELAKQLKDAGFKQVADYYWDMDFKEEGGGKIRHKSVFVLKRSGIPKGIDSGLYAIPSLSQLIEACGDEFFELGKYKQTHIKRGKFSAFIHMDWYRRPIKWWKAGSTNKLGWQWRFRGEGSTPEEAVARLWLELNK